MAGLSEAISWYGTQMLLIATALGMLGSVLALRIASPSGAPRLRAALPRLVLASQVLVVTGWVAFLGCLEAAHPGLDPHVPPDTLLEAWAAASVTALLAMLIAVRGARNLRNAALAGSLLSSGVSCMAFIGMSGLVAPAVVAYHLGGILLGMGGGSVLAGLACWLLRAPHERAARRLAGPLIAAAMVLIVMVSFASILSFSDWSVEVDTPGAIAFRPIVVVSVSELVVTTLLGALGATIDHRAARLTSRENDRLRELTESTFEALAIHRDGFVLDANAAFCRMIGRPAAEVKGERLVRFLPGQLVLPLPAHARDSVREVDIVSAQGETLPVEVLSRDITYGGERASVLALRDITERRRAEDQIRFLAHHDALTGLPNRAHVQDMMVRQLALSQRSGEPMAVLCLDLDRFKAVNDTFGHQAGDRLLQLVAERLLANIRTSDAAARIGGDEFVLLLSRVGRADSVAQLARRLIEKLSEPFDLGGFEARIGASIGIAVGPHDGTTAEALVKNADVALYRAKASGRGGYCFFEAGMDRLARERRVLEQALRQAVAGCQFDLVYQPQFTTVGTRVVALEALVRWQHPERGAVSPVEFIPLAESTGLIVPLGHWVMQTACRAAVGWSMPCRVAVNVSPRQFVGGEFAAVVTTVLQETGLPPDRLELEVTESLMMHDADAALACLQQLKAMGVHVALDDFGTGFSSLSYLQRFPFDKVKIDRSFITDLIASDSARAIVGAIVAMAHHLRLAVTAEGVETVEQLAMLRRQNCDMVQGFLLSRPLPADQVPAFLEGQRARPEEVTLEVVTP